MAAKLALICVGGQKPLSRTFRLKNMARSPSAFRQTDVTRALNAARAAGYNAARILIGTDGRIEIVTTMEGEAAADTPEGVGLKRTTS